MTEEKLRVFIENPPEGFNKLAFGYRQSIAKRRQLEDRVRQIEEELRKLQSSLVQIQRQYIDALGVEKGYLESINAVEELIPTKERK